MQGKKIFFVFLVLAGVGALLFSWQQLSYTPVPFPTLERGSLRAKSLAPEALATESQVSVGVVGSAEEEEEKLLPYLEILKEEGFPFRVVSPEELAALSPAELARKFWALIFPEDPLLPSDPSLSLNLRSWVEKEGGKIFAVGSAKKTGAEALAALESSSFLFALAGLAPSPRVFNGPWIVPPDSPLRNAFDPGVINQDRLQVPEYPPLSNPHLLLKKEKPEAEELLTTVTPEGQKVALATLTPYPGGGSIFFLNAPVGLLKRKANDDFLLRVPLKYFLIEVAGVPRLVAAPCGKGGIVLNMHICSRRLLNLTAQLLKREAFSPELPMSFAITAGPDLLLPRDNLGVDATGRGKETLLALKPYGNLGIQGGWRHDYWGFFFDHIPDEEKRELVRLNWEAVSKVAGYPATEYAAPRGRHSKAVSDCLAELGVKAIAFPAAFNSPPTRAYFQGEMDARLWLFPYTGTRYGNCMENMLANGRRPQEIVSDVCRGVIDVAVRRREIRLFYSHPSSLASYPEMWAQIKNYLLAQLHAGNLTVRTMTEYAAFLDRHQAASFSFQKTSRGLTVTVTSHLSLKELTFALPVKEGQEVLYTAGTTWSFEREGSWLYATIEEDTRAAVLVLGS